jgi:hypothetical protein
MASPPDETKLAALKQREEIPSIAPLIMNRSSFRNHNQSRLQSNG